MGNRERILARLRRTSSAARFAVTGGPPSFHSHRSSTLPRGEQNSPDLLLDRLQSACRGRDFDLYQVDSLVAARLHLATWLKEHDAAFIVGWAPEQAGVPGLAEMLDELRIHWQTPKEQRNAGDLTDLSTAIGLARADAALADRGSLVFRSGPGRSLREIVQVERLLVLLSFADLFPSWNTWISRWREASIPLATVGLILTGTGVASGIGSSSTRLPTGIGPSSVHIVLMKV